MALPAHLQHYDSMIDLIVESIVREIEQGAETKTPAGLAAAGVFINSDRINSDGKNTPTAAG